MSKLRFRQGAIVLAIVIMASAAQAQSSTSPSISKTVSEVKEWTLKKWKAAKREWRKDKEKWHACNDKAADQKLTGRKSWSFLYTCMTSS